MPEITGKTCLECHSTFRGRIDKKFCSDQCRSTFNNRLNAEQTQFVRRINFILRKNRRILMELSTQGKSKVEKDKLRTKGFDFRYFTSTHVTNEGSQYIYCYDQAYVPLEKDCYLLISAKKRDT
jgi:hypothetical protein